jgi:hypothetical protein
MASAAELLHNPATQLAALSLAEGAFFVGITTEYNHRELTHQSIELTPIAEHVARTAMWMLGVQPRIWAAVHLVHHSMADVNMYPIIETADYLLHRQGRSEPAHPDVPRLFGGLDRDAVLRPEQVIAIGQSARQLISGRYEPPLHYNFEDARRLLDPRTPRFMYKPKDKRLAGGLYEWEQPDLHRRALARLLPELRDPHSPPLHEDGVPGVFKENVSLYKESARYFQLREDQGLDLGRDVWDQLIYDHVKTGMAAFYTGNIALQTGRQLVKEFARNGELRRSNILKAVAKGAMAGTVVAITADGILILGGDITNGPGHAGDLTGGSGGRGNLMSLSKLFKPEVVMKPDGTYTTDHMLLGWVSLDEAGRQGDHHDEPGNIAYTGNIGLQGFQDAPYGKTLQFAAKHKLLGIRPGKQYGARDAEPGTILPPRPDVRHESVVMLQQARVETRRQQVRV